MIRRLTKLILLTSASVILILLVFPFFVNKEKIITTLNNKIEKELNLDLDFDENIKISFIPFPELTVKNLLISDKMKIYNVSIPKVEIISTWSSIFKFNPQIQSIKFNSPSIKIEKIRTSRRNIIFIKNNEENRLIQIKSLMKRFKKIIVNNGSLQFVNSDVLHDLQNLNLQIKKSDSHILNAEFNYINLKSFFKITAKTKDFKKIKYNLNQSFDDKNEIFGSGLLELKNQDINLTGKLFSEELNIMQLADLFSFIKQKEINIKTVSLGTKKINLNLIFDFDKVNFNNFILEKLKFTTVSKNKDIILKNLQANYLKSLIKGEAKYFYSKKNIKGQIRLFNFLVEKNFSEKSNFGFNKALFDCEIEFSINKKTSDFFDNIKADGECDADKANLSGLNIERLAKGVDNLNTFQDFFDLFNKQKMQGVTKIDSVNIKFGFSNGILRIKKMEAIQRNVKVISSGKYNVKKDKINLKNNVFLKTEKYKNLPSFDVVIKGTSKKYDVSYDFDKVKSAVLTGGINSILKEQKKIVIDPKSFKNLIDKNKKEFNPEKIIDLFLN